MCVKIKVSEVAAGDIYFGGNCLAIFEIQIPDVNNRQARASRNLGQGQR